MVIIASFAYLIIELNLLQPLNSQIAIRTLNTISQSINGIHSFMNELLNRINISINNNKLVDPAANKMIDNSSTNNTISQTLSEQTQTNKESPEDNINTDTT